jgi:hypothetical protein
MRPRSLAIFVTFLVMGCKPEAERLRDQQAAQAAAAAAASANQPAMPDQVAKVGVGVKGDSLEGVSPNNPSAMISAPVNAYFKMKESMVFNIQIPKMMELYKATNGRAPKNHDEFMQEIKNNKINLPQLPQGMVYRYHPDTAELWVENEKNPASK